MRVASVLSWQKLRTYFATAQHVCMDRYTADLPISSCSASEKACSGTDPQISLERPSQAICEGNTSSDTS